MSEPHLRFVRAEATDAAAIAALLADAARELTKRHGEGPWSRSPSERAVLAVLRRGTTIWCAYRGRRLAGTWTLGRRKPWAIDPRYFTPGPRRPWYLTDMAVAPAEQGLGIGRRSVERALADVRAAGGDARRLDAYAGAGGAGEFYTRCGFREVGRASYRGTPHVYFEYLLPAAPGDETGRARIQGTLQRPAKRSCRPGESGS